MLHMKRLFEVTPNLQGMTSRIQWRTLPCLQSSQWPRCLQALSMPSPCLNLDLCQKHTWQYCSPDGGDLVIFCLFVSTTLTPPVLELYCDVTPTSKVAKTGEWSLVKMSSVQPGETNPPFLLYYYTKYVTCSVAKMISQHREADELSAVFYKTWQKSDLGDKKQLCYYRVSVGLFPEVSQKQKFVLRGNDSVSLWTTDQYVGVDRYSFWGQLSF